MSITDELKRLILTARAEPAEQVPVRAVPQPEQAQSSNASDNDPGFSESDMLEVQQRAETVLLAFNESLSIANQSKIRETREHRLQNARESLVELKQLANKFPFLHLKNLQAVETSVISVEAETGSLPYLSEADRQAILMCIKSEFRVINESVEIARKSKNLETKVFRLGVARNSLKEAQKLVSKFSLEVEGFDAAEAEINGIDEAIKTGTPTEIAGMLQVDANAAYSSAARNLLIEATALKGEKKFVEACDKLREAYSADGAENLFIEERLRLPMYLQLAGKNDEGWDELNRLSARYVDQLSQPRIANQMRIFLRKENNETASNPVRVILRGDNKPQGAFSEPRSVTMAELQNAPMRSSMAEVCNGFKFSATLQLRTPLRVLLRHGEIYLKNDGQQPQIAREGWEGIWLPVTKRFEEIAPPDSTPEDIEFFRRLDVGLARGDTVASDVGPVVLLDYLPFLIAVRRIIEAQDTIEHRIAKLREMPIVVEWREFVSKHGGIDGIIHKCSFQTLEGLDKADAEINRIDETSGATSNLRNQAQANKDDFLGVSLAAQCQFLAIPLEAIDLEHGSNGWTFAGKTYVKPEPVAFAYFSDQGFHGTSCEGSGPLMLLKCACLDFLAEVNPFKDRSDACLRYFEAQCVIHKAKADQIVGSIRNSTEETIRRHFREIRSLNLYTNLYPDMKEDGLASLWNSIGSNGWSQIAQHFLTDPYRFRAGWPDLALAKGKLLRLIEIKTTDRLHSSQRQTIENLLLPCGLPVSVLQISRMPPSPK